MKVSDLRGKTVGFAASGGLDSCTITRWLADHEVQVVCFTADLGQPDEPDLALIQKRMLAAGAAEFVLIDAKAPLAEAGLRLIQAQAYYEGKYWNTTGVARHVTVEAIIPELRKRGVAIFSHGATGRGNDQVRFQLAMNMLAPDIEIYAPWRDEEFLKRFGGRSEMIDFCNERKLPITASKSKPYSTDANMLGLTHEAGVLESLKTAPSVIEPGMGVHPWNAAEKSEQVRVTFVQGRPTSINGKEVPLVEAFQLANAIGGRNGVAIGFHLVENRFVGIKSRGVYESPGMELLGASYEYLLQLVLDRRARELFQQLAQFLGKQIYQGYGFDLGSQMAMAALAPASNLVTGTVTVSLYRGTLSFVAAEHAPHGLYSEELASMEAIGSYNHADSEGLLRVLGVSARALAAAKQV